jgi:F-type H+-transporting ATPase subunit b
MKHPLLILTAAAALALLPPSAPAQDHAAPRVAGPAETGAPPEEHGAVAQASPLPSPQEGLVVGIASLIVFGIVFAILSAKVWPKINQALADRENKIRSEIEAAEQAQKQARHALEQYEKNLSEARAQAQKMLDDALVQQQALAAELKARSEVELTAMRDRARKDIEFAKKAALGEIYTHSYNLAASIAAKILKREITARDQDRLVEESLAELNSVRN